QSPKPKSLVAINSVVSEALFVEHLLGSRQAERPVLQIERLPASGRDILVVVVIDKRIGQEPRCSRALKIPQRLPNLAMAQMHQPVATKDQIDFRESVADHVTDQEPSIVAGMSGTIPGDQGWDNIDPDITLELQIEVAEPIEIPAGRVEQAAHAELANQSFEVRPKERPASNPGSRAGHGLASAPGLLTMNLAEDFAPSRAVGIE